MNSNEDSVHCECETSLFELLLSIEDADTLVSMGQYRSKDFHKLPDSLGCSCDEAIVF